MLFVDDRGTKLVVKKLVDCKNGDIVLTNDGAIVAKGQVLNLLSNAATVYVKPPDASIFFKRKEITAKYERRKWTSMEAKPVLDLVKLLVAGGMKAPGVDKGKTSEEPPPVNEVDND